MNVREKVTELDRPWQDKEVLEALYEGMTQVEMAEYLGCSNFTISTWMEEYDISTGWNEGTLPYEDVAMFSGGYDSLASTHYVMEELDGDVVLHIDTRTGISENRQFVEDVCDEYGWELEVIEPETSLEEFAVRWGFPKPGSHSWIYRYLKEHPLSKFTTRCANKPVMYTGVRKDESARRMENVSEGREDAGKWVWASPIAEWTDDDVRAYRDKHDLPTNPVSDVLGRSGECFCGAFPIGLVSWRR